MKLYEITSELTTAVDRYNSVETDEELREVEKALNDIQLSFDQKAIAVAHHILNVEANLPGIEAEIKRLTDRKNRLERQAEWFSNYLKGNMEATNTLKVEGQTVTVKVQNNPKSVTVLDETKIPGPYRYEHTEMKVDKKAIKESWDKGVGVEGTKVEQKTRLVIK